MSLHYQLAYAVHPRLVQHKVATCSEANRGLVWLLVILSRQLSRHRL